MAAPDGFTCDAAPFVPPEIGAEEADGLWHVTVARDRVLATGLRSRRQLGHRTQGLGGGHDNQAPDLVSLTWSSGKAAEIEGALRLAARAARDEIAASAIFEETAGRYGLDWFGPAVRRALREEGVPPEIAEDEWLGGLEGWLDANVLGGEAKYGLLQRLDDAMEREFDRDGELPTRVGLTAPFAAVAAVDPSQVCLLRVAAREGAEPEVVLEEAELRFAPGDLAVLGPAAGWGAERDAVPGEGVAAGPAPGMR